MTSGKRRIVGWVLTGLLAALLMGPSALGKLLPWEGKQEMLDHLGFTEPQLFRIGILEVTLAGLLLIPRTSFVGAILLTGYLGGATVTHVRVNEPFVMPVLLGVVMWVGLGLRRPAIFALAQGSE